MEFEARQFAKRVLLIHLLLLVLVVLIVALAAGRIHQSVRLQAIEQSKQTQELAQQTANAIEGYYQSITTVMDSLKAGTDQPPPERLRPPREPPGAERRREQFAENLWDGIRDRVSNLIVIDPKALTIVKSFATDDAADAGIIVADASDWIRDTGANDPLLSEVRDFGVGKCNLLCVHLSGPVRQLLLAVIPIAKLETRFLDQVNRRANIGAMLVDENGVILSNSDGKGVGLNVLTDFKDPRMRLLAKRYFESKLPGTEVFQDAPQLGDVTLKPSMTTIRPVKLPGRTWSIVISSSLADVDGLVNAVFREAIGWAIFVVVSMTAILVSTSIQLIRGRARLERMQQEVLSKEMEEVRRIQLHWLPKGSCQIQNVQIAAVNQPATRISGDFYNWFELEDGRLVVMIGDVTGHGMAAAFLMATTQLLVRNVMPRSSDAAACLDEVNRQLCTLAFNGQFVTMLILVLDSAQGTVEAASAGHPAPLLGDGEKFTALPVVPQLVLGVDQKSAYKLDRFDLAENSSLVLFTDGVTDAQDPAGNRFESDRLSGSLVGRFDSAETLLNTVHRAVDDFRLGRDFADDLTIVTIQLQPSPANISEVVEIQIQ